VSICKILGLLGECVLRGKITQFAALIAVIGIIVVIPSELVVAEIKIQLVLFVLSVRAALVGIRLGLDARKILIVRHNAISRYERSHVVDVPEALFSDMVQTKVLVKKMNGGGASVECAHGRVRKNGQARGRKTYDRLGFS